MGKKLNPRTNKYSHRTRTEQRAERVKNNEVAVYKVVNGKRSKIKKYIKDTELPEGLNLEKGEFKEYQGKVYRYVS